MQEEESSLQTISPAGTSPLSKSFNHKMRPLLDAVDKLRSMGAVKKGINLPTIVLVGDLSSGKSSVLESLSGVELPKGLGIVTRVPLVLRLEGSPLTKITIAYGTKSTHFEKEIAEAEITDALASATNVLAGSAKGIAENPITLHVSKPGAPDLTFVDLPGITRVPVQSQPSNIYNIIHALIQQYIKSEETIILNVLSPAMDFSVCESIRICREVDKLGKRTLDVVTKVDMCPDGLVERISNHAMRIGRGYICVRNRTAEEASFEEAAEAERVLLSSHTGLKRLSKSIVGVEALADQIMQLQVESIAGVLPEILKQIDDSMEKKWDELDQVGSESINNAVDASIAFFNVSFSVRKSLEMILSGGATSQCQDHYLTRLHQKFENLSSMLMNKLTKLVYNSTDRQVDWDQMKQIKQLLSECGGNLPIVAPQSIVEKMVTQIIDSIASTCTPELPSFVHEEACKVAFSVVVRHARRFPYLKKLYTASFQKTLNQCKSKCSSTISRLLDMEKAIVYTTGSEVYNSLVNKFLETRDNYGRSGTMYYDGDNYGRLRIPSHVEDAEKQAGCRVAAYWIIVSRRLADHISCELRFSFQEALLCVTDEVMGQVVGGSLTMEQVMAEQPEITDERQRLTASLDVLHQSKEIISQVLDDACFVN